MLLHLDGMRVKEMSPSAVKKDAKANKLLDKHIKQINLDASDLANFSENKNDIKNIKFNCD